MNFDLRALRICMAGVVFGAGASFLFTGGNERAQYVFFVCLIGWVALFLADRLRRR